VAFMRGLNSDIESSREGLCELESETIRDRKFWKEFIFLHSLHYLTS
jgi:hypothetical protein